MDYEFYPQALENVIRKVAADFKGDLIVTENGIATADDTRRVAFIEAALAGVQHCIADGIPVKGYFHWSLMDNFEWQKGYAMNFGLIAVIAKRWSAPRSPALRRWRIRQRIKIAVVVCTAATFVVYWYKKEGDSMDVFQNMELFSELIQCGATFIHGAIMPDGSLLQSNCPEAGFLSGAFDLFGCKKKNAGLRQPAHKARHTGTAIGMTWAAAFEKDGSALKRAWVIGPVFYQDVSLRGIEQGLQYYNRLETSVAWSMQLYEALKTVPVLQCTVLHRYALMMHYCLTGNHLAISDINSEDLTQVRNAVQQPAHDRHKVWMAREGLLQMVAHRRLELQAGAFRQYGHQCGRACAQR